MKAVFPLPLILSPPPLSHTLRFPIYLLGPVTGGKADARPGWAPDSRACPPQSGPPQPRLHPPARRINLDNSVPRPVPHEALVPGGCLPPTPPSSSIGLPNIAAVATAGQDTTAPSVSPGPGSEGQELIIGPWAKPRACLPARWALPPPPPEPQVWSIWSPSAQWAEGGA